MTQVVHHRCKQSTDWLTIDRPATLNAINEAVFEGLERALNIVETRPQARVLVLRGAGARAFVSGGDLRAFATLRSADEGRAMAARMGAILARIEALPCWTIACINGDAYGGGCETALAFDFRIASTSARFGFTQARFGLPPGWGGLTRLVHLVGRSRALDWLSRCAVIDAQAALEAGLVDRLAEPDELEAATARWAEELGAMDRQLIVTLKQGAARAEQLPRQEAIEAELKPFAALWASNRHHERVQAFFRSRQTTATERDS